MYALREPSETYGGEFAGKNDRLRVENTIFWEKTLKELRHRAVRPRAVSVRGKEVVERTIVLLDTLSVMIIRKNGMLVWRRKFSATNFTKHRFMSDTVWTHRLLS